MSIDSHSETDNEPLDQVENLVMEKKKNNKWRIKVETKETEKLEHHVKNVRDSIFRFFAKETSEIYNPIMSGGLLLHREML